MYYPDDVIEEVRQRNDIVDVISSYVKLQRKGSSYFGLCPFHNEKTPSFSVSPGKQMYYCFGCGAGGSVFNFIMEYENCSFPEAVQMLADRAGISLPEEEYSGDAKKQHDLKNQIYEINKTAAKFYHYQLRSEQGARGMDYFRKRGLTDETIVHFGLGYAGQDGKMLYRYLKEEGFSDQILKESGLMQVNERQGMYDKFWNRVIFPIMDIHNKVIGFGGRVMGDAKPKYLNSPETLIFDKSRNLYGLNYARSTKKHCLLLCEGYMDVISMHQAGFTNAVASLGTALTAQHAALLKRYTDEVILTYDSDDAGIRAALRAIPLLKEAGVSARVLHMDPYKDPDEFIRAEGPKAFQERIDQAENSFMFELSVTEQSYDMKDPDGKTRFFQAAAGKIAGLESEIEQDNYIEAVCGRYQISYEGMRRMVKNCLMQGTPPRRAIQSPKRRVEKEDGNRLSQRLLLSWLAEYPDLYDTISSYIHPEDFTDELYRDVAEQLYAQLEQKKLDPVRIMDHYTEPEQQRQVAQIFNSEVPVKTKQEQEKAIADTIQKVMRNAVEQKSTQLNPADLESMQSLIDARNRLQSLDSLHISLRQEQEKK